MPRSTRGDSTARTTFRRGCTAAPITAAVATATSRYPPRYIQPAESRTATSITTRATSPTSPARTHTTGRTWARLVRARKSHAANAAPTSSAWARVSVP